MPTAPKQHPYDDLTPDVVLDAVETYGRRCTGGLLALNSYENRVYRVDIEDQAPVVAKFYRPGRWSDATIREEHEFEYLLAEHEIPAVAPLANPEGDSLSTHAGFGFALFPWRGGRNIELNRREDREVFGRYLGRLHRLGAAHPFQHRLRLSVEAFGHGPVAYLLEHDFLPDDLRRPFRELAEELLAVVGAAFAGADRVCWLRLHGDCHLGNVLDAGEGPVFVDFDDCLMGPAIQDLWMLLSGEREEREIQLAELLAGYTQFADFNRTELRLIEPLRSLRLLYYDGWLARRWDDPAFPRSFPWFNTRHYWQQQLSTLREQASLLNQPPLNWVFL